jgi:serine/threonine-protein kinase RsbW
MAEKSSTGAWQRSLTLPSERGSSRLVTDELLAQLGAHGWPPDDVFAIHLATEEALVNAVVHGNQLDPQKTVQVECHVSPELVRLTITDEGAGFDPQSVPDCTLEERLEAASGRGVMLMRSFMSRIEYNPKGNSVLLEKRRGDKPAAAEPTDD